MCLSGGEKLFWLIEGSDGKPVGSEQSPDRLENSRVVIYQADNVDRRIFNGRHAQLRNRPIFNGGRVEQRQTSPYDSAG